MEDEHFYQVMLDWFALFARYSLIDFHNFTHRAGLTLPQMNVLMRLYYQGSCETTELVGTMLVSKAAVSQMVERMVQQELVLRVRVPEDRRARKIELTEKGRNFIEESIRARQGWLERIGEHLNADQKGEIAQALHVLAQTVAHLDPNMPLDEIDLPESHRKFL